MIITGSRLVNQKFILFIKVAVFHCYLYFSVIEKGQVMSPYFRLLNKTGGYTWMQICATVVINNKNGDEQNIICVNYVIRSVSPSRFLFPVYTVSEYVNKIMRIILVFCVDFNLT